MDFAWFGKTTAEIYFYSAAFIAVVISVIMMIGIARDLVLLWKEKDEKRVHQLRVELESSVKLLITFVLVFGILLAILYFNMKETEKSKRYAETEGVLDLVQDIQSTRL